MHGFGGFGGGSFVGLHAVWWLFWVLLIVAVLAYLLPGARSRSQPGETPLERLQYRYANGEITAAEYEERKKKLEQDGAR